jgi:3-deoxy-manno-octulosonate cytidylyltransferase (CMP-KDO synthetase)
MLGKKGGFRLNPARDNDVYMTKKILGIIPARFASTRFPAKALADIAGKTMVERVYEQAMKSTSLDKVVVATDHVKIMETVQQFGGNVVMTNEQHPSGTDRCFEALQRENLQYDYLINIQGDEPFIKPEQIDQLATLLDGNTQLATMVARIHEPDMLNNTGIVKVIFDKNMNAIYFSRESLPFLRGVDKKEWLKKHPYFKHVSLYAYRSDILADITALPVSSLELAESLEQLRWLENGYKIKVGITEHENFGIDTPEDLEKALIRFL